MTDSIQQTVSPLLVEALGLVEPDSSKGPGPPNPKPCNTIRMKLWFTGMGDSILQGDRGSILLTYLERFAACQEPGSRTLWRHCRSPCNFPLLALPVIVCGYKWYCQGKPGQYQKWLHSFRGSDQVNGGPGGVLNPAGEVQWEGH